MTEYFSNGHSFFHKLDARVKIIAAFVLTVNLALTHHYSVAGLGLVTGLLFLLISQVDLLLVCRQMAAINLFTFFLWLTLPLTYGGHAEFNIGPLPISTEGVGLALLITLKTNAIVLIIISLPATSSISALGHGLNRLHISTKLCCLLLYSYRYIFVIHQEYKRLLRAAKIRCFTPHTSIHTYKTYAYLFGMTVIKSWNRSERVNQAMVLRGFSGKLAPLDQSILGPRDYFFLVIIIVILLALFMTCRFYPLPVTSFSSLS